MPDAFTPDSKVCEVVARLGDGGRALLRKHGYEVGEGFTDVLSQYQSLENAARADRVRDLDSLISELNSAA